MRVCIAGAGGVGATIGARLAAGGQTVALLARGANLAALRAQGLRFVDAVGGQGGVYRLPASDRAQDLGEQDVVVLASKAHQLPELLDAIAPLLGARTLVVPAVNGMPWWYFHGVGGPLEGLLLRCLDPQGRMMTRLPAARIVGCVVHFAAQLVAPGEVHCTAGRRLILGAALRTGGPDAGVRDLARHLVAAGFEVEVSDDIRRDIWVKLIGNASFNPVAALTGYRMDQICADEGLLDLIRAILREAAAVAASVGVDVGMTPDERIAIARQLGAARISMLQDIENRRTPEIGPIVGAVIELAQHMGLDVPATRAVHALVQARARALGLLEQ